MASDDVVTLRINADTKLAVTALDALRRSQLEAFAATRKAAGDAEKQWAQSESELKRLSLASRQTDTDQAALTARMETARTSAAGAKASYQQEIQALAALRVELQKNAAARAQVKNGLPSVETIPTEKAFSSLGIRSQGQVVADIANINQALEALKRNSTISGTELQRALTVGRDRMSALNAELKAGSVEQSAGAFAHLNEAVVALAGGGALIAVAAQLATIVDEMNSVQARVRLASGSLVEFQNNLAAIVEAANRTGVPIAEMARLFNRIALSIRDMGGSAADARRVIGDVSNALRISGSTASESAGALLQFSQAIGAGVLRGEELNSVLENAPRLARAIADGLGITTGALKKLGEDGALTSQMVMQALKSQSGVLAEESARLPRTIDQASTALNEQWKLYVAGADRALGVSQAIAAGLDTLSGNMKGTVFVGGTLLTFFALMAAQSALASTAVLGLTNAVRVLTVSLMRNPVGLVMVGASIGIGALLSKLTEAKTETKKNLAEMTKDFEEFSGRMGEEEKKVSAAALRKKVDESWVRIRNDPNYAKSDAGAQELDQINKTLLAIRKLEDAEHRLMIFRTKERGLFSFDEKGLSGSGFLDKDTSAQIKAIDLLYSDFTQRRLNDNGRLVASSLEIREAFTQLLAGAKSMAGFSSLQAQLQKPLADKGNVNHVTLTSIYESVLKQKADADRKEMEALTQGLLQRLEREADFVKTAVDQAMLKVSMANAQARILAELKNDDGKVARIDRVNDSAEIASAREVARQKLAALDVVANREVALALERSTAVQNQYDAELASLSKVRQSKLAALGADEQDLRLKLQNGQVSSAEYSQQMARIRDERAALTDSTRMRQDELQKLKQLETAVGNAGAEAADSIARADRDASIKRKAILEELQSAYKAKFNEALAAYKKYSADVIALDKRIAQNRQDIASDILAIDRKGMTPDQLKASLKKEMEEVQALTREAMVKGQRDTALELLQRQRQIANQLANTGTGSDTAADAKKELQRIGAESETILQQQRQIAQEAANAAAKQAVDMSKAINALAEKIAALSKETTVALTPSIDPAALDEMIKKIQDTFSKLVIPIKVAPQMPNSTAPTTPTPTNGSDWIGFNQGGVVPGGYGGGDRVRAMLEPGEVVLRKEAVREYGLSNIIGMNALRVPLPVRAVHGLPRIPASRAGGDGKAGGTLTLRLQTPYGAEARVRSSRAEAENLVRILQRAGIKIA